MPYLINPMPTSIDPIVIEKLLRCNTATIGHVEHEGFLLPEFAPVIAGRRIAGTAVTMRMPPEDSVLVHYVISGVRPGDVLILDRGGESRHAAWGGTTALAAMLAGAAAAIVDGPTTDLADQREAGFPCWGRGASALTCKKLAQGGSVNIPVSVGGITINPGDAILADDNGIYVCAPGRVEAIADHALSRQAGKGTTAQKLRLGAKLGELSGADAMVRGALQGQGATPPW